MKNNLIRKELRLFDEDNLSSILEKLKNVDLTKVKVDISVFDEGCCDQCRSTVAEVHLIWYEEA
jgi:hypothetical protein